MFFNYTFKFVTLNTRVNICKKILPVQISSCIVSNNINILIKHVHIKVHKIYKI